MKRIILSGVLFLFTILFAGTAFAQADKTGMYLRAGVEVPIFAAASISANDSVTDIDAGALLGVGPGLDVTFGYRWKYFGLALEQQVGVLFATDDSWPADWNGKSAEDAIIKKGSAIFLGATYFLFMEFAPITNEILLTFSEGLGASYGSGNNKLFVTDTDAAFAFKADIGITYFLFEKYGLGFNFEIAGSMAISDGVSISYSYNPMLAFSMIL